MESVVLQSLKVMASVEGKSLKTLCIVRLGIS